ncbi:hypothetical protein GCM10027343_38850 [Noviherbaspirillum agri]
MKKLAALILSLAFISVSHAAADPDRYLLTPVTLKKMHAVTQDLEKANIEEQDDEDDKDLSVEEFARLLESNPKAKAVLAKNGISAMDYALATYAMLAAGLHLMFEPSMDKKKIPALLASYPKERQANIELLRKNPQYLKAKE